MSAKVTIQEDVLRQRLEDENTSDETLEKYFELDDSSPFNPKYVVKSDVEITQPEVQLFGLGKPILWLANSISRRSRLQRYNKSIQEHPDRPRIVSEGDSWFQHPTVTDTIDHLSNYYSIYSLGAAGDEFTNMFRENEYLPAIEKQQAKALLLSGGGNDLLGDNLPLYLSSFKDLSQSVQPLTDEFHYKVGDILNLYQSAFEFVKNRYPNVHVFTHGYDYVIPQSGRKGKWLGKVFSQKGYPKSDPTLRNTICNTMIDEFNKRMTALCSNHEHVTFIDVRGTVRHTQWHDEIHPNSDGFGQVAHKFIDELNKIL